MEIPGIPDHVEFWQRAGRHLLKFGGEFVDFVPVRAAGSFRRQAKLGGMRCACRPLRRGWPMRGSQSVGKPCVVRRRCVTRH